MRLISLTIFTLLAALAAAQTAFPCDRQARADAIVEPWGDNAATFAVALTPDAQPKSVALLFCALIITSAVVFLGYAILFSSSPIARGYARLKRVFDLTFGVLFGAASLKLLTTRLNP